jgi:hypothetical protein
LGINDGFEGDVVLAVELPEAEFRECEEIESMPDGSDERRLGRALIPSALLNQHGPAQIYAHEYAGMSRPELLHGAERCEDQADRLVETSDEASPDGEERLREHAARFRAAIKFFD